jgi:hypothetical protein
MLSKKFKSTSSAFYKYFYNLSSLGFSNFFGSTYIGSGSSSGSSIGISASIKGEENDYFGLFYRRLLLFAN